MFTGTRLPKCGVLPEEEESQSDDLETGTNVDKFGSRMNENKVWFLRIFSGYSSSSRNSSAPPSYERGLRSFLTRRFSRKQCAKTNEPEKDNLEGEFLWTLNEIPNSIVMEAKIEGIEDSFLNFHIQLEKVPVCKECDVMFDDTDQLLALLMKTKVKKVLLVSIDGQGDCFGCSICNVTTSDRDAMKNHLMKHIESNEITCEECEDLGSVENSERDIMCPDRNLQKVRLSKVFASCRLCTKIIKAVAVALPEVMTVDDFNNAKRKITYVCVECNCDLPLKYKETECNGNMIASRNPLCKACRRKSKFEAVECHSVEKARKSWTSPDDEVSMSDLFPLRHPPPRRHVFIMDKKKPVEINSGDFLVKDAYNDANNTLFSCRFCGDASVDKIEIKTHIFSHILINKVSCDECESDVC